MGTILHASIKINVVLGVKNMLYKTFVFAIYAVCADFIEMTRMFVVALIFKWLIGCEGLLCDKT